MLKEVVVVEVAVTESDDIATPMPMSKSAARQVTTASHSMPSTTTYLLTTLRQLKFIDSQEILLAAMRN